MERPNDDRALQQVEALEDYIAELYVKGEMDKPLRDALNSRIRRIVRSLGS